MDLKSITRRNRSTPEKVKRSLFGPVNHEINRIFMEQHLSLEYIRGCRKWNFNFREEIPLDGDGDYIWTPPSPVPINRKRKPAELPDNSSAYYFQPIEGSSGASHLLEPLKPVARSPEQTKMRIPKQSLITVHATN
ncbi:CDI domain containing protein [Asbolus verrucosus]|uniref:CDI domain containing protein n=1 Tax=Asbolus verrucosus TaxID=1661398 RepID=A0A482WCQ6_ASBVE|nr:CDI domain containing protein [Asbolus verrucosus]